MALLISKQSGAFHSAEIEGVEFQSLYGRISFVAHPTGESITVTVGVYSSENAYGMGRPQVNILEKADIELQKNFNVAGYQEQTTEKAHELMKNYLESGQGGNYDVQIDL
jgi:hypothetical protein